MINVDAEGKPLRPAILWLDQRQSEVEGGIKGPWGWLFKLVGAQVTVDHFRAQAEANWIARHQPEVWAATDKFLLLSGFLTHRLCGRFVDSVGCCVGYLPFDFKACSGPRRGLEMAGPAVAPSTADLHKPGETLGYSPRSQPPHRFPKGCR